MKNMKKWTVILIIAGVLLISLLVGIWTTCQNWSMLAAISTWVLAGGIGVAIWQIIETRKSTNAQIAVGLFEGLREKDAKNTLRKIYGLRPEQIECLPTSTIESDIELRDEIDNVTDWLDLLGALVAKGIVDDELAIEGFSGVTVLRCWFQLAQYIRNEQNKRGYYAENYEVFTRDSLEYFGDAQIQVSFKNDDIDIPDLVTELQKDEIKEKRLYPRSLKEIKRDRKRK